MPSEVPKHMNFFWANEKMSWLRYMTLYSFRKHNPDWPVTLYLSHSPIKDKTWTSVEEQDFFSFKGDDWLPKVEELDIELKTWKFAIKHRVGPSQQSNFFKWSHLATQGGFYSDLDIIYMKSLEPLYSKVRKEDAGLSYNDLHFSIGFLFSKAESPLFSEINRFATKTFTLDEYQSAGVKSLNTLLDCTGSGCWDALEAKFPKLSFYNVEMPLFYPISFREPDRIFELKETFPKETLGLHWYAGLALAQKHNNLIKPSNLHTYKNTSLYLALEKSL